MREQWERESKGNSGILSSSGETDADDLNTTGGTREGAGLEVGLRGELGGHVEFYCVYAESEEPVRHQLS